MAPMFVSQKLSDLTSNAAAAGYFDQTSLHFVFNMPDTNDESAITPRLWVPGNLRPTAGAAPRTSTRSPGLSACTVVGWYTAVRSVARNTRPSLSVIIPVDGSTAATVPVASTGEVAGGRLPVPEGGDEGDVDRSEPVIAGVAVVEQRPDVAEPGQPLPRPRPRGG